jgi:hypothetical protein
VEEIKKFNQTTAIFSNEYIKRLTENPNSGEFWNISNLALWYAKYHQ